MEKNSNIRYSDSELLEFKELIEKKLENAKTEFEFLSNQILELNGSNSDREGGDIMDDSNKQSELELLNNMVFRQKQFIRNLENALIRIRNKTYGICTVTGFLIDKKRLMLVPHATKSVLGKNATTQIGFVVSQLKKTPKTNTPKTITKIVQKKPVAVSSTINRMESWEKEDDFDEFDAMGFDLDDEQNFSD